MELFKRLRSRVVLHRAWAKVRTSGLKSESERTKRETLQFEDKWLSNLERIRDQLRGESFQFRGETGITPPKGRGKTGVRPLIVAPVANRVVRRAILEILQGFGEESTNTRNRWAGVAGIREVLSTPTSVGGVASRGVPHGLALVDRAIRAGKHWFIRSDIREFFTRIPKGDVNAFVRSAVNDKRLSNLFEQALAANLENEEELKERHLFKLFPDPEIGVAQGSALSALAGNIALRKFDATMNDRGVVCVRYIDDFILLANSEAKAQSAFRSARKLLNDLDMDVYDSHHRSARKDGKFDQGNIFDGTDLLGYRVSGHSRQPCKAAYKNFLRKLDAVVKESSQEMRLAADGDFRSKKLLYHRSMVQIHKVVWGWSQSFRHTTARHVFDQLDKEIEKRIGAIQSEAQQLIPAGDVTVRRRVTGIHLLADTLESPLPEIE